MTTEEMKAWIDSATYAQLLSKWRFAPVGDRFFQGEVGEYYSQTIKRRREEEGNATHVAASKAIGW